MNINSKHYVAVWKDKLTLILRTISGQYVLNSNYRVWLISKTDPLRVIYIPFIYNQLEVGIY